MEEEKEGGHSQLAFWFYHGRRALEKFAATAQEERGDDVVERSRLGPATFPKRQVSRLGKFPRPVHTHIVPHIPSSSSAFLKVSLVFWRNAAPRSSRSLLYVHWTRLNG